MNTPQHLLGGLLALQILLTGGLYIHGRSQNAKQTQQAPVLTFDKAAVTKIVLSDKEHKVVLTKNDQGWQLPEHKNLPADQGRLDQLLTTLAELTGGWPVATSSDSQEQFEVNEKKFASKVELFAGDKPLGELYLGTSPGFRKTHVRNAKETNIYAAAINASVDAPVVNDRWMDPLLLKAKDPTSIKGPDFALTKNGDTWSLAGKDAKKLNAIQAEELVKMLKGLRVEALQTAPPVGPASLTIEVTDQGKPLAYQFWAKNQSYSVKRSDNEQTFGLAKPTYDALAAFGLAKLTEPAPPKPDAAPKEQPSSSSVQSPTPTSDQTP